MAPRSRTGCHNCKARKVKCDEKRPQCSACQRRNAHCDYRLQLNWLQSTIHDVTEGAVFVPMNRRRNKKKSAVVSPEPTVFISTYQNIESPSNASKDNRKLVVSTQKPHQAHELSLEELLADSISPAQTFDMQPYNVEFSPQRTVNPLNIIQSLSRYGDVPGAISNAFFTSVPYNVDPGISIPHRELFELFLDVTAERLVPMPFPDNPFKTLVPRMALDHQPIAWALAAYGAVTRGVLLNNNTQDYVANSLVKKCSDFLEQAIKDNYDNEALLTLAMLLSSLEADRGRSKEYQRHIDTAVKLIDRHNNITSDDESNSSLHLVNLRMVAYMESVGKLTMSDGGPSCIYDGKLWPAWSPGLDYLTGVDLNLIPLCAEVANLAKTRAKPLLSLREISTINKRALAIFSKLNDYFLEINIPVDELSAFALLYQMAVQIHIYRRILCFPMTHYSVQRIVHLSTEMMDKFIPVGARIQENMSFIIVTLASETMDHDLRSMYLQRMMAVEKAGFTYARTARASLIESWANGESLITSGRLTLLM